MLNAGRFLTFYEFDSGDLLLLYREMDDRDEEPAVIYPLAHCEGVWRTGQQISHREHAPAAHWASTDPGRSRRSEKSSRP
jgi:hypothetical protein